MKRGRSFALQVALAAAALEGAEVAFTRPERPAAVPMKASFSPAPCEQYLRRQVVKRETRRRRGEAVAGD